MERKVMVVVVVGRGRKKESDREEKEKRSSPGGDRTRGRMKFGEQKKAHVGRGSQRSEKES